MFVVYALKKDENIIYVGQTKDFEKRIQQHKKEKEFDSYLKLKEVSEKEEALLLEDRFIKEFNPKYNKMTNEDGLYGTIKEYCVKENVEDQFILELVKKNNIKKYFGDNYLFSEITKEKNKSLRGNKELKRDEQKSVIVWLDKDVLKQLKQLALDKETSVSAIVRDLINKELENKNK